jgi:hypothetical protein
MSSGIVAKRAANALVTDAVAVLPELIPRVQQVRATLDHFGFAHRGLWVGGQATLTTESVCFHPNPVNRGLMRARSLDIEISLPDLVSVEVLPALVSSVIALRTPRSTVRIRCFRASRFARQIAELAGVDVLKAGGWPFRLRVSGELPGGRVLSGGGAAVSRRDAVGALDRSRETSIIPAGGWGSANLRELMERMGHDSARAASIYLHSSAERQRAIADQVSRNAKKALAKSQPSGTRMARGHSKGSGEK